MRSCEVDSLAAAALVSDMTEVDLNLTKDGFRVVINVNIGDVADSRRLAVDN